MTNQYHGVRDIDLAILLGKSLGMPIDSLQLEFRDRVSAVSAIKQAVFEG